MLHQALEKVAEYAGGHAGIDLPLTASTPAHRCCEVYILRGAEGADDVPIGGIWGKIEGTVWTHIGMAILPAYRGNHYHREAGQASRGRFFNNGGTEILTEILVPGMSEKDRARRAHGVDSMCLAERDGIAGKVRIFRITKADCLSWEKDRQRARSETE